MAMIPLLVARLIEGVDEDLGNSICLPYFNGLSPNPEPSGQVCLNVNDIDTVKILIHKSNIPVNTLQSIHRSDDSTPYQNLSGKDAVIILIIHAVSGTISKDVQIYDSPNNDSKSGATLRLRTGAGLDPILSGINEKFTMGIMRISNNNFCVIENNTNTANNDINIVDAAYVVERGA